MTIVTSLIDYYNYHLIIAILITICIKNTHDIDNYKAELSWLHSYVIVHS